LKIRWDDGEQVTWRRDSLAERPIEILDAGEDQSTSEMTSTTTEQTEQIETPPAKPEAGPTMLATEQLSPHPEQSVEEASDEPFAIEKLSASPTEPAEASLAIVPEIPLAADSTVENTVLPEPTQEEQGPSEPMDQQSKAASPTTKRPRQRDSQQAAEDGKEKKLSALDAAAKVLAETGTAMTCQELIAAMAEKGYWTSPGGRTPQATLYSAMLREITTKGSNSRFQKTDRGKFSRNDAV
jgi:hypothetical protein